MLKLNLQPVFKARGIEKPYSYLVKQGFTTYAAHNLLHSTVDKVRLRDIDKLCVLLHCTPNELLVWAPNRNDKLEDSHPLTRLKNTNADLNWQDTIKTVPLDELELIVSTINKLKTEKKVL